MRAEIVLIDNAGQGKGITSLAKRLGVHPTTVYRWILGGVKAPNGVRVRLAATRLPGGWRVAENDLEAFLAALNPGQAAVSREQTRGEAEASLARIDAALAAAGW